MGVRPLIKPHRRKKPKIDQAPNDWSVRNSVCMTSVDMVCCPYLQIVQRIMDVSLYIFRISAINALGKMLDRPDH